MDKFREDISKKRKTFNILIYAIIFIYGCFMFPITNFSISEDLLLLLSTLVTIYLVSLILYGLYYKKTLFVFCSVFIFNSLGLLFRVLLEGGEACITQDLTLSNVIIHLIVLPVLITLSYTALSLIYHKN